ncbi:class II aldolase/adducin family protein [Paraburkholderia sp. MPAMCS5]|uniref:class II aldolase/adducin family protein n=1 Tax=Paraburkholderia sp. MPAMCS5 TaxID=3112563 RepID=UPI002E188D58|nr:class II aldolase/adducin family protein [Paraburkholderia sp. MPAMCS5]
MHSTDEQRLEQAAETAADVNPNAAAEQEARVELASCYRLFDWLGWTELIFNHITVRVPGTEGETTQYLINPFGLHYSEVTPENLVKIDISGKVIGQSDYAVNKAGFVIHSALHAAREDAHCIMHMHTTAGCAVSCKEEGLRHDNFYSAMLFDDVAYHDYEGVTTDLSEQPRLVASIGTRNHVILRNHGILAMAADLPTAFNRLWTLQRACEIQLASDAGHGPNRSISESILRAVPATRVGGRASVNRMIFDAMVRKAAISFS